MASNKDLSDNELSGCPYHVRDGMIRVFEPIKRSSIERGSSSSSLGTLDKLPLELLHATFEMLDFRSLSRVTRVSLKGKAVIESVKVYRLFLDHASEALAALGKTRLIVHHSGSALLTALKSGSCVSCGEFGPFLFLPTCERCCYHCLRWNPSLWVMPIATASKCFALNTRQMKKLPTMLSIPGTYFVGHEISRRRRIKLVSVRAAKELGIEVHGLDMHIDNWPDVMEAARQTCDNGMFQYYHDTPLQPQFYDRAASVAKGNLPSDPFCGMASVAFPSLSPDGTVRYGFWCRGCQRLLEDFQYTGLAAEDILDLVPGDRCVFNVLHERIYVARSREKFKEHVKTCYGVRRLVPGMKGMFDIDR